MANKGAVNTAQITLRYLTGNAGVDEFVRRVIAAFERSLPGRVRGYYVIGSYADGSATPISDLDLVVLFTDSMTEEERRQAGRLGEALVTTCPARLDLTARGEDDHTWEKHHLRWASQLFFGEDVRHRLAESPEDSADPAGVWSSFHFAQYYLQFLRGGAPLTYPLGYPDPAGAFFGYDAIRDPTWYPPGTTRGLRELVNAVTFVAAVLLQPAAGRRCASKRQAVERYAASVDGPWAPYVEALYGNAKLRWGYLVPEDPGEQRLLRQLCAQSLGFENHFLDEYRALLSSLLQSGADERIRFARDRLQEVRHLADGLGCFTT